MLSFREFITEGSSLYSRRFSSALSGSVPRGGVPVSRSSSSWGKSPRVQAMDIVANVTDPSPYHTPHDGNSQAYHKRKAGPNNKVSDTTSKSGLPVINADHNVWGAKFVGSHAIKFRNKIWVGVIHGDALAKILNTYGQNERERSQIANIIDNDQEPIEFGYYYDRDFHEDPLPGMAF